MMSDPSAIGIMEGAYFVSKRDLLEWLRRDFGLNIAKIEECGTGVIYLRIMDRMFPGKVPLKKMKPNARQEYECLHNLKILQAVFQDCSIRKHIDIDRLSKCMYLDNLEFLQWIKCFYDRYVGEPFSEDLQLSDGTNRQSAVQSASKPLTRSTTSNSRLTSASARVRPETSRAEGSNSRPISATPSRQSPPRLRKVARNDDEVTKLKETIEQQKNEMRTIEQELENTQKETHFYFGKLRKLEMMSNEPGRTTFTIEEVQEVLFTEEDFQESLDLIEDKSCDVI